MPEIQRPVVLIGLGGTGKQTLLYLRRMFLDRYGAKTLPHIAMVVLDTDGAERNLDKSEYNEFDREAAFGADDKDSFVKIPLDETLANFRRNRDQYPHIDSWFDKALDSRTDITDGAGQIRSMGRFAFFTHYPKIRAAFHEAYQRVNGQTAKDEAATKFNITIDPGASVETWVIFSVAGGTGAGMFLDAAFLAKQEASLFPGNPSVRSIILLPTAFSNNLPHNPSSDPKYRLFANAYASLRELESYNYPQGADSSGAEAGKFQVQWTIEQYRQRPRQTIDGPVFNNSYLVDSAPRDGGGQTNGDLMGLCQMSAEWLFVQYSSAAPELTDALHTIRSNDNNRLTPLAGLYPSGGQTPAGPDDGQHVQLFSRRYSGFGLSKIYVPTVNVAEQAYAKLVADLANMWLTDEKKGDVRKVIERMLYPKIHLPIDGSTRGFTEALGARLSMDGAKQPLKRRIDNLIEDKYRKLKARGFEPGAENEARDWFSHEVMTNLLDSNPAVARRGEITRIVDPDNAQGAFDEISKALDEFLSAALARSGDRMGFADTSLDLVLKDFQKAAEQAGGRVLVEKSRSDKLQGEADALLRWASEARGFDRMTLFEAAFAKMKDRAGGEFRRQVFEAIVKVANDAAAHIGIGRKVMNADGKQEVVQTGLKSGLETLRQTLKVLAARANQRIVALRTLPASPLNYRAPAVNPVPGQTDEPGDLELIYKTADGKPLSGPALWELESRLYQSLGRFGFDSPWFLRDKTDAGAIEEAFRNMLGFARRQLDYLPARMQDALACFQKKIESEKTGQFDAEVTRVMDRGSPWLPEPLHNLPPGNDNFRRIDANSYVTTSGQALKSARDALFKIVLKNGRTSLAGPLDTVYFESEVAGVPLCAVRYIDLYRNAYLGYLDSQDPGTRVVHTELDTEKYTDLVPLTVEENELRQDAVRAFIQGVVRGLIEPETRAGGLPEWKFFEDNELHVDPFEWRLGRYSTAIRLLSRHDRALYSALMQEIAKLDANRLTQDDIGYVFAALSRMDREPPIAASDWKKAMRTVLDDMRAKYGASIVEDARRADATNATWRQSVANGSNPSFLVVKGLARQS